MRLIVWQLSMKPGWWDTPLALRDLAEAIKIIPNATLPNKFLTWNKTKYPMFSFPWRRTHPMRMCDKAKNVWIIVGQLSAKAGWWDIPLTLQSFSRSISSTPNYINDKLGLLSFPSLVFNKKFTILEWTSKYMFYPIGKRTLIFAIESCRANHYATDMELV